MLARSRALIVGFLLFLLPFLILIHAWRPGRVLAGADVLLASPPWSALAPGVTPHNPLLVDVAYVHQPAFIHGARELAAGRLALWNPYVFAGAPFLGNAQTALMWPLTWLGHVLPPAVAITLTAVLKLAIAGLAMRWLLRRLALGPGPAAVGAVVFMLSGTLAVWLQWPFTNVMIVLPLLLGATEGVVVRRGSRPIALLALVVALAIVAGYPQTAVHGLLAAAVWAICRARTAGVAGLVRFSAGVMLGVGVGAVQAWPFLDYLAQSSAFIYRSQWMPTQTVPWRSAIALLIPYYYGSPTGGDFWGDWNFNEMTASVGLLPWLLAPTAVLAGRAPLATKFFTGMAVVSALTFFELPGGVPGFGRLPLLSLITTSRVAAFLALALAALTAIGLDGLAQAGPAARRQLRAAIAVAFGVVAGLALLALLNDAEMLAITRTRLPIAAQYAAFLALLTLTAVILLGAGRDGGMTAPRFAALIVLHLVATVPVVVTANPAIDARLLYPVTPPPAVTALQRAVAGDGSRVVLGDVKNIGMLYGLREVAGYDALTPRRIERVASPAADLGLTGSGALSVTTGPGSPVFDLLAIRHVLTGPGAPSPDPRFVLEYDGADARVWRNERALPRAFLVHRARSCLDDRQTLGLMHEGAIDFREEVVLAACDGVPAAGPRDGAATAAITRDEPTRIRVSARTETPAYLVLTDTWFTGWRVRVDGAEQPLWRANHAFRSVWLPAGRHDVEFSYWPPAFWYGLGLSAVAATLAVGLWLFPLGEGA